MVEFINKLTGTKMFVADDRVEEYKAAGHTAVDSIVAEAAYVEVDEEVPVVKKATKKRKVTKE